MTTPRAMPDFLAAFRARRECCRALLSLSAEQASLIATDDFSALLSLLEHKQHLLETLLESHAPHNELRHAWQTSRDHLPASVRQECEQTLAETESLLRQLLEHEQTATELLTARRNATEQALQAVRAGQAAHTAYDASPVSNRPRHLDVDL